MPSRRAVRTGLGWPVVAGVLAGAGCHDAATPIAPPPDRALFIDPDTVRLRPGDSHRLRIRTRHDRSLLDLVPFVSAGNAVSVDGIGVVRALRPGVATVNVNATADGEPATATARLLVTGVAFEPFESSPFVLDRRVQLLWHVYADFAGAGDQRVVWRSSDPSVLSVTETGLLVTRAVGSATITAVAVTDSTIRSSATFAVGR